MHGEAIIAALVGAIAGGGGARLFGRLFGAERTKTIVDYQLESLTASYKENKRLRKRLRSLEAENARLERVITDLEEAVAKIGAGELPPEYS
jgi:cell division protein FtsB